MRANIKIGHGKWTKGPLKIHPSGVRSTQYTYKAAREMNINGKQAAFVAGAVTAAGAGTYYGVRKYKARKRKRVRR